MKTNTLTIWAKPAINQLGQTIKDMDIATTRLNQPREHILIAGINVFQILQIQDVLQTVTFSPGLVWIAQWLPASWDFVLERFHAFWPAQQINTLLSFPGLIRLSL